MRCQHCNGNIIGDSCLQCGRAVKIGFIYRKLSYERMKSTDKPTTTTRSKRGTCLNCGRPDLYLNRGLCGACVSYVNGVNGAYIKAGTPEYFAALIKYREKRWPDRFRDGKVLGMEKAA